MVLSTFLICCTSVPLSFKTRKCTEDSVLQLSAYPLLGHGPRKRSGRVGGESQVSAGMFFALSALSVCEHRCSAFLGGTKMLEKQVADMNLTRRACKGRPLGQQMCLRYKCDASAELLFGKSSQKLLLQVFCTSTLHTYQTCTQLELGTRA
jgi:hypothetical protein